MSRLAVVRVGFLPRTVAVADLQPAEREALLAAFPAAKYVHDPGWEREVYPPMDAEVFFGTGRWWNKSPLYDVGDGGPG